MLNLYQSGKERNAGLLFLLFMSALTVLNAQANRSYSFISAGHAYGAHEGENTGLHPALLQSLHSGFDSTVEFMVFTGDIVNFSTAESWLQVEKEVDSLSLRAYYVMGNHDDNQIGNAVFEEKFGGLYYSFYFRGDLFIVLNSIEADRAISDNQLIFLKEQIEQASDSTGNVFIFFHELIWNSHEKYKGVRSNSRSRHDQVLAHSNYWEEVHPILMNKPGMRFFLVAGDVGGNPDAISAFYDQWDHITFLASGMGEVADENYLLVHVYENDSLDLELVPLNRGLSLPDIEFYSVPPTPGPISGPDIVFQGSSSIVYSVPEVFNADSYLWDLPAGASGSSSSNLLFVDFDDNFGIGELSVRASRDGFGESVASSLLIQADYTSRESLEKVNPPPLIRIHESKGMLFIKCSDAAGEQIFIRISDSSGKEIMAKQIMPADPATELQIPAGSMNTGVLFISAWTKTRRTTDKIVVL